MKIIKSIKNALIINITKILHNENHNINIKILHNNNYYSTILNKNILKLTTPKNEFLFLIIKNALPYLPPKMVSEHRINMLGI